MLRMPASRLLLQSRLPVHHQRNGRHGRALDEVVEEEPATVRRGSIRTLETRTRRRRTAYSRFEQGAYGANLKCGGPTVDCRGHQSIVGSEVKNLGAVAFPFREF